MITQKQIETRDEMIFFLFYDLVPRITYPESKKYISLRQAIADADKEAAQMTKGEKI